MHYKIYQLTKEELPKEDWIDASTFEEDCPNKDMDYVSDINPDWRNELIDSLAEYVLPKGCFARIGENELLYLGGLEKYIDAWLDRVSNTALSFKGKGTKHILTHGYELYQAFNHPTDTFSKIYDDEYCCLEIGRWMTNNSWNLASLDSLYVGGIVDFHI